MASAIAVVHLNTLTRADHAATLLDVVADDSHEQQAIEVTASSCG